MLEQRPDSCTRGLGPLCWGRTELAAVKTRSVKLALWLECWALSFCSFLFPDGILGLEREMRRGALGAVSCGGAGDPALWRPFPSSCDKGVPHVLVHLSQRLMVPNCLPVHRGHPPYLPALAHTALL